MKTITKISTLALLLAAFGVGVGACAAPDDAADQASPEDESVAEAEQALVTCTSNCSATGGPSITKTCQSTCTANNSSITCDGVTTQCAPLPPCATKCSYGVCTKCDDDGFPSTCYVYNGCGHKYPVP